MCEVYVRALVTTLEHGHAGCYAIRASRAACKCVRVMAFELEVISEGKHAELLMTIRDSLPFQFVHLHSKAERKERVCLYLGLHKDRTPAAGASAEVFWCCCRRCCHCFRNLFHSSVHSKSKPAATARTPRSLKASPSSATEE